MFYISSRGSSACTWLAKMLSRHPQIVCFRSTRCFPPYMPGDAPQIQVEDFMEGLLECKRATLGEKIFGSMHGYHGLLAKDPCEKREGLFSYIIRHPVSRINSAHIFYLNGVYYRQYMTSILNKEINDRVCSILTDSDLISYTKFTNIPKPDAVIQFREEELLEQKPEQDLLKSNKQILKNILPDHIIHSLVKMKKGISQIKQSFPTYNHVINDIKSQPDEKFIAGLMFVAIIREFLNYDSMLFRSCSLNQGIKMEEMVKSREYFNNHLRERVAPELNFSDTYLKSVVAEPRFNVHRDKPELPVEIWNSWPNGMKEVFLHYFESYDILPICKAFNYDVSFM